MNKRVKIVATLGPAVEIRGGKKFGDDGYWGEKLDVEASAQNIAKLIEAGANTFRFNFSHGFSFRPIFFLGQQDRPNRNQA